MNAQHFFSRISVYPLLSLTLLAQPLAARAEDWPQWRGIHRDGHSPEKGIAKTWPESGPKLLWQNPNIGTGYSSPTIIHQTVFIISNEGLDNERVLSLSAQNGQENWSTRIGKVGKPDQRPSYPAARSSVTADGDHIFALGSDGDLACLESKTGKAVWTTHLPTEYGGESGTWAYSESPLVLNETVICSPGGANASLLALNKSTGKPVWKCSLPGADKAGYSSPVAATIDGTQQVIQILEKGLVGVDAKSGQLLWHYDHTADGSPAVILTPVIQKNLVYSGGGRTGGGLVRITRQGSGFHAEELYFSGKLPTSTGGAVLVGDYLYGSASQSLLCIEFATGKIAWEERSVAPGSLAAIDNMLILHGESGAVALLEANPDGYQEKGRFTPANQPDRGQSKAWAHPAIANGKLYLRDWTSLWCYDLKAR